ncbi:tail fiber protein [Paenibacillus lactis]|uniref:tail fiber protein n=1 Tax=Paenibacillus lactis TaxID=228574 RepID=UPI001B206A58|nr:phage tail protein [Paenibacillus lactis]GIO93199.1 hypothetical protein J31TS3_44260 [Paenibacillus lactis]
MASNTPNLGLLKKDPMTDGNETFNIETMLNENWDKIDTAVGQVREGLENVNVDIPDASLTEKGIVQLSSATNGTRENVAATEKAVKAAYDEALAGKQLGVEQKANVVAALNSIGVSASTSETWAQLIPKITTIIQASGNATAADLLVGKSASNASGAFNGGMPNRSAENHHMPGLEKTVWAGDRYFIKPPSGFYDGASWVTSPEPNLKPENIRTGVNVGGVVGTLQPSVSGVANLSVNISQSRVSNGQTAIRDLITFPAGTTLAYHGLNLGDIIYVRTYEGWINMWFEVVNGENIFVIYNRGTSVRNILGFSKFSLNFLYKHYNYQYYGDTGNSSGSLNDMFNPGAAFDINRPTTLRIRVQGADGTYPCEYSIWASGPMTYA